MNIIRLILVFCLTFIVLQSSCDANEDHRFCVPETEFIISGIVPYLSKEQVLKLKGAPVKTTVWEDERVETLEYSDMEVGVGSCGVFEVSTSSTQYKTPSGISPGMSKKEVMKILNYKDTGMQKTEYQFVNCSFEFYLVLKFNEKGILEILEFAIDLP